jgi:hypothetical protein
MTLAILSSWARKRIGYPSREIGRETVVFKTVVGRIGIRQDNEARSGIDHIRKKNDVGRRKKRLIRVGIAAVALDRIVADAVAVHERFEPWIGKNQRVADQGNANGIVTDDFVVAYRDIVTAEVDDAGPTGSKSISLSERK